MARIEGARCVGLDLEIGSLGAGKKVDLIAIRSDTARLTPLFGDGRHANLHHNLVHAVRGSDVALTMIDGRVVVEDGVLKTADLAEIIVEARKAALPLFARRDAWSGSSAAGP